MRFDDDRLQELTSFRTQDGSYFRRGYVTFNAKAGQWGMRLENDFAIAANLKSIREMWISHPFAGGDLLIGQHKPFRGLEELSSSNELSVMERPFFATTMFGDNVARQFQPGLFWRRKLGPTAMLQVSTYNANHGLGQPVGPGYGTANRLSWYPINTPERVVYFGAMAGYDRFNGKAPGARSTRYAGRSSAGGNVIAPSQRVLTVGDDAGQLYGGIEAAYGVGPVHLQSEVLLSSYEDARGPGQDDRVLSYYGQLSAFLTGERKEYQIAKARFGTPHQFRNSWGAVELAARYDAIENLDRRASSGSGVCQASSSVVIAGAECEQHAMTVGLNYYVTPLTRVMVNVVNGWNTVTDDHTQSMNLRVQLAF